MMEEGKYAEAAQLFLTLSRAARRRGTPVRAAGLAIRASQAYLAQDRVEPALNQLRLALEILVRRGQAQRAAHLMSRATRELTERGFQAEADELNQYADQLREEAGLSEEEWHAPTPSRSSVHHGSLPDRCTGCGAPLIPDDVAWHDAETAECRYCGAIIKTV
jgi:hypothetical protein